MTDDLELVQFMTAEIGDDLILSFFVAKPHDPIHERSIILMRDKNAFQREAMEFLGYSKW